MKIEAYIKENGLTQQQFADLVGVSQSTISRLRDSKLSTPIGLIQRIFEATKGDVKPEDFFPFRDCEILIPSPSPSIPIETGETP